ncbi:MAG: hypothetical protein E6K70_20635, partial [Planctomycetota bacterium]
MKSSRSSCANWAVKLCTSSSSRRKALEGLAVVLPSRFQQPAFNTVGDELRSVQVQGLDVECARLAQGARSRPHLRSGVSFGSRLAKKLAESPQQRFFATGQHLQGAIPLLQGLSFLAEALGRRRQVGSLRGFQFL